jgi:Fe-S cluster biogenesis protein NfuA
MNEEIKQRIEECIRLIRPELQADGGDVRLVEITPDYVVRVELQGACSCCCHSLSTLKHLVEATLKERVPEVKSVEDIRLSFI